MNRDAFEVEVVALAKEGVRVTAANVSARLGLSLRTCQTLLDMMARDGQLEREGAGDDEASSYRVRGLDAKPKADAGPSVAQRARAKVDEATRDVHDEVIAAAGKIVVRQAGEKIQAAIGVDPKSKRHLGIAALVGLLLGPLGLFYAAPWLTAILATAGYAVLGWLPFLRGDGMWKFWMVVHLGFALASFLYAVRFNRVGERAPLLPKKKGKAPPAA